MLLLLAKVMFPDYTISDVNQQRRSDRPGRRTGHSPNVRQDFLIFQDGDCTGVSDPLDAAACLLLTFLLLTFLAQRRADPNAP